MTGTVYLLHFDRPCRHARHYVGWALNVKRRLAEHEAGRGARPGPRAADQAAGRPRPQMPAVWGQAAPAAGEPGWSLSRSRTTDVQKLAAGVMTAAQLAEHTALRRDAVTGKSPRPAERGPALIDLWRDQPAGVLAIGGAA
jgi:hypothetical protein